MYKNRAIQSQAGHAEHGKPAICGSALITTYKQDKRVP